MPPNATSWPRWSTGKANILTTGPRIPTSAPGYVNTLCADSPHQGTLHGSVPSMIWFISISGHPNINSTRLPTARYSRDRHTTWNQITGDLLTQATVAAAA